MDQGAPAAPHLAWPCNGSNVCTTGYAGDRCAVCTTAVRASAPLITGSRGYQDSCILPVVFHTHREIRFIVPRALGADYFTVKLFIRSSASQGVPGQLRQARRGRFRGYKSSMVVEHLYP